MTHHPKPELISAFLDGELRGFKLSRVKKHLSECPLCAAEYRHVKHVRRMLRENPPRMEMTDAPEFFWHKVKSEIEARGDQKETIKLPRLSLADWISLRQVALFRLASVTAVVAIGLAAAWLATTLYPPTSSSKGPIGPVASAKPVIDQVDTPLIPNTVATVLDPSQADNDDSHVTVIWVSGLPWTKNMTELQTVTANPYYYLDI
jgi:anti-sigma factor RsiW